jgi:hypothetical protein
MALTVGPDCRSEAKTRLSAADSELFRQHAGCRNSQANRLHRLTNLLTDPLMINPYRIALHASALERVCTATIRRKPLEIGATTVRNEYQGNAYRPSRSAFGDHWLFEVSTS